MTSAPTQAIDREARRNAIILSVAGAISGSAPPIAITLGGLTGLYLLDEDKSLATLPVSGFNLGVALGALPAALLMRQVGRRTGFIGGTMVALAAGLAMGFAVLYGSFGGFFVGMTLLGFSMAFAQQYRFAAADSGGEAQRAKAISWVLLGGVASAIIGPQIVIFGRDLLAPIPFAGAYFAIPVLAIVAAAVLLLLGGAARGAPKAAARSGGRPLLTIVRQPRFIVAVICAIGSYALMALVMTAAPLAIVACGLGETNAALGIQWHVLAMFVPSFFTGILIARFGVEVIIAIGMVLLAGAGALGLAGIEVVHFWGALILLGLGWNFGFIGATTMLTETYRIEERGKVQGLNDLLVFGSVAAASFSSGKLFTAAGWEVVNMVIFPVVAIAFLALAAAVAGKWRHA